MLEEETARGRRAGGVVAVVEEEEDAVGRGGWGAKPRCDLGSQLPVVLSTKLTHTAPHRGIRSPSEGYLSK